MIYLMSQITLLFLYQIYYNMNFITSSSVLPQDFPGTLRLIFAYYFWRTFFVVHKKCLFRNISSKLLKELGILLKRRETLEKFVAAWNSSKNAGLPQFFQRFLATVFKEHQFPNKNQKTPSC